jgi:hypothetical protein
MWSYDDCCTRCKFHLLARGQFVLLDHTAVLSYTTLTRYYAAQIILSTTKRKKKK